MMGHRALIYVRKDLVLYDEHLVHEVVFPYYSSEHRHEITRFDLRVVEAWNQVFHHRVCEARGDQPVEIDAN